MNYLQRKTGARVRQVFVPADESPADYDVPGRFSDVAPETGPSLVAAKTQVPKSSSSLPYMAQQKTTLDVERRPSDQGIVSQSEMVRGFEYEKNKYVEFEPEELEKIAPKTSEDMQIVQFVRFAEVDPVYLESSYYVAADKGGDKAYALLFEALKKTGYAAIAELVMHRRDQTMILRTGRDGIIAHTLFYEDEVRHENEFHANADLVLPKEMDLAVKLVEALAAKFEPDKFKDKYREKLRAAISEKIETGAAREVGARAEKLTPVVDIMAALKESLVKAKKPVASESSAGVSAPEKKRTGRK